MVRLLLVVASLLLAFGATVVLAAFDTEVVHNDAELASIDLGMPLDWVSSRTGANPPYPYRMSMSGGMDVRDGRAGSFFADVGFWWLVEVAVLAIWLATRSVTWRMRASG